MNYNAPANEALQNLYMERAIDLLRLEAGTRNKVFVFLRELESELVSQLVRIDPTGIDNVSRQRTRLEKLLGEVRAAIRSTYRDVSTLMTREIRELIDDEFAWTGYAINSATGATFSDATLTRAGLANLVSDSLIQGAKSADWWGRQAAGLSDRFADEMRRGVALGESNSDLVVRLRGKSGQPGLMEISRNSAERLVRASVQAAANTGREAMYAENDDLIASLQWHATLDTRTSKWCITRDGHLYSNTPEHLPKSKGAPPWLEGPGKIHWGALAEGTRIKTARGQIPIENVRVGDSVLTHTGKWSTVSARRAKYLENGIVRVIHTKSGRILRATDDHPVRLSDGTWVFVGALEVGNYLLCDSESVPEISDFKGEVYAEAQDSPALINQTQVAIQRAFKLVASDVDFEGDPEGGYREIEHRCFEMILGDPAAIERDQSFAHHLFAMADALQKVGRDGLRNVLASLVRDNAARHALAHTFTKTRSLFSFERLRDYIGALGWIVSGHSLGVSGVFRACFLSQTECPMMLAGRSNNAPGGVIETGLFGFVADNYFMPPRVTRKRTVGEIVSALNATEGKTVLNVSFGDQGGKVGVHEQIVSLDVLTSNICVYDLEVEGPASYIANGLVVSNCRSTSVPILKSWRDLGIDEDEVPETTRASMDGQVPAQQSFEEWLRKQGEGRQNTVLGTEAADLWRRDKISFRDLLDQSGRPLTTEQLRAKAARR